MAIDTILARAPASGEAQGGDVQVKSKMPSKAKCIARMKQLHNARRDYVTRWKEIRDFQLPFIGEFDDTQDSTNPARRRDLKIAQGVAWLAAQAFAAGVMSGLTPPSRQWFKYAFSDNRLDGDQEAARVLDERQAITANVLAKTNFYNSIHSCYMELPFGQACLGIFPAAKFGVRFTQFTIGSYYLASGADGKINVFGRKFKMTAHQLEEQFGRENLPDGIQRALDNNQRYEKLYTVNWLIEPNDGRMPDRIDKLNMPYRSIYWLDRSKEEECLYVGGCEEFPTPAGRYQVAANQAYGQGPGWFAEGDSKSYQLMKKDYLTALELGVKPPVQAPPEAVIAGVNLIPGGLTPVESTQKIEPLFQVNVPLNYLAEEMTRVGDDIRRAYSADLFLLLDSIDSGQMTAREVMERTQEKLQQLGPVVERLQDEFLNPIIERVYNILDRAGVFPPIPPELAQRLAEEEIKIEYISPLAQAQKMSGLVNIEQSIAFVGQMVQLWPEVRHKVDPFGTLTEYFKIIGTPAGVSNSDEKIQQMLEAEQAAMQQQQQLEQGLATAQAAAPAAQAAKNLTDAALAGNPAVADWMGMGVK